MLKKKNLFLFGSIILLSVVFFARRPLACAVVEYFLQRELQTEIHYTARTYERGRFIYKNVQIGEEITAKAVEVSLSFSFFPFYLETGLCIDNPKICVDPEQPAPFVGLPGLIPSKYFGLKLDIEEGEISPGLSFTFASGPGKDQIGTLVVYDEMTSDEEPLLYTEISLGNDDLRLAWSMGPAQIPRLATLAAFFAPQIVQEWMEAQGEVEAEGVLQLTPDLHIVDIELAGSARALLLHNTDAGIQIAAGSLDASIESVVGRRGTFTFTEGSCLLPKIGITGASGGFTLAEASPFSLEGHLVYGEHRIPLAVTASVQSREDISIQGSFSIGNKGDGTLSLIAKQENDGYDLEGTAIIQGEDLSFQAFLGKESSLRAVSLQAPHLSSHNLQPVFDILQIPLCMQGAVKVDASFEEGQIEAALSGQSLTIESSEVIACFPDGKESVLVFDTVTSSGSLSLKGIQIREKGKGIVFEEVEGVVDFSPAKIASEMLTGLWRSAKFETSLLAHLGENKGWKVAGRIADVTLPIRKELRIEKGECSFAYDSDGMGALTNLSGFVHTGGTNYPFSSQKVDLQKDAFDCDLKTSDLQLTLSSKTLQDKSRCFDASGKLFSSRIDHLFFQVNDYFELMALDGSFHAPCSDLPLVEKLLVDLQIITSDALETSSLLQLQGEIEGRVEFSPPEKWSVKAQGNNIFWAEKKIGHFEVYGKKIQDGWSLQPLQLDDLVIRGSLLSKRQGWEIPVWEAQWKGMVCRGKALFDGDIADVEISSVQGALPDRYQIRTMKPLRCTFKQIADIDIALFDKGKLAGRLEAIGASFSLEKNCWEAEKVNLFASHDFLAEPLEGIFTVRVGKDLLSLQGVMSSGSVEGLEGKIFGKELALLYEPPYVNVKLLGKYHDIPLQIKARLNAKQKFKGGLTLQTPGIEETVAVTLSENWTPVKIDGSWQGMEFHVYRNNLKNRKFGKEDAHNFHSEQATIAQGQGASENENYEANPTRSKTDSSGCFGINHPYTGVVKITDGAKAASALGEKFSLLKEISGFTCSGKWSKQSDGISFEGSLLGEECIFFGRWVEKMSASLSFSPTLVSLADVVITDPAGSVEIKKAKMQKDLSLGLWNLSIPLIKGQNIRPSKIQKIGVPIEEKPLFIRNIAISHLEGTIGKLESFQGRGSLNFTNVFKKEPSFFDAPIQVLKNLGLDLGVFTPVLGLTTFKLQEGKVIFTELENSFSEGGRSEFFLDTEPSFIDLNGKLNINLRMKQNVVVKIAEPFALGIRGTIEKPRYFLR